ncbi:MAG: hypothetical protein ACKV22_35505 [Bryobacteraceae bacterium]
MTRLHSVLALAACLPLCAAGPPYSMFSLDDHTIPFRHNLYLTMNQPVKYRGNPVVPRGPAGNPDAMRAQFYGSVIRVGAKWRMWYAAMAHDGLVGSRGTGFQIAYAESDDGLAWRKPNLGLTEFNGNRNNNLIGLSPKLDYALVEPLASFVLHEPEESDPSRRYKMLMYGRYYDRSDTAHRRPHATVYPYFSADGLRWKLARPDPGPTFDETTTPFTTKHVFEIGGLYKFGGIYYVAGQEVWGDSWMPGGEPAGRTMMVHWSGDFIDWSQDKVFAFQRYGYRSVRENLEEAHEPAGVWNRGNVLLATYGLWHGAANFTSERRMDLGFLVSNDGLHFREPIADAVFIAAGKDGEWDRHGLIHGQGYENVGGQTYIYYGTWDLASAKEAGGAVGVAMLPRDRFGSISTRLPGYGQFTTIPIPAAHDPRTLRLNVDGLGSRAALRVEVIDAKGKPLPGYSGGDAALVRESGLAVKVNWPRGGVVARDYRLRVRFEGDDVRNIRFFAAYLGD